MGTSGAQHLLGPHVVGQRVVIRHLLPDGRATDVLGICLAWTSEHVTVDRDGAGPVRIALADVVTGKPVPPRASVRHRVSAHDVELHTASLWPTLTAEPLGEWVLRSAPPYNGRLRRRANSALALREPAVALPDAAAGVRVFYGALDQDPLIQVLADSEAEAALALLGFVALGDGDAHCQLAPVSRALRTSRGLAPALAATLEQESPDHARLLLEYADPTGTVIARGEAAVDGDWVGLHAIEVDPARRRQGLATAVIADLLDWGASLGAITAWLHVETDNQAGTATYERLGFVTHHTTRYLRG